jgi:NAD-dependent SIR2 family protein deacetylase
MTDADLDRAVACVSTADALVIGAGAGMGVDSGMPDFRGTEGFWNAYPRYKKLGLRFSELSTPRWFVEDPTLAWGFFGHRLNLYRGTNPHAGFDILLSWARRMRHGAFVYTSNVDGHFQRAGFDPERVLEIHGSIHWMQCHRNCGVGIYPATDVEVKIDEETLHAREPLPTCPFCPGLARPNILMFEDGEWDYTRSHEQETRFRRWLKEIAGARLVLVECGAGTAIPTVRRLCEQLAAVGTLIRINVREAQVPAGQISFSAGALTTLRAINERIR